MYLSSKYYIFVYLNKKNMILSCKFKEALKEEPARLKLALELNVSYQTIYRWYKEDPERFATLKVIAAVEKVIGLRADELFEEEQVA